MEHSRLESRFDLHRRIVEELVPKTPRFATPSPSIPKVIYLTAMADSVSNQALCAALAGQYRAALETLNQCIEVCDDDTWSATHPDTAVNQVVFHALFFTDLYLGFGETGFRDQPFHRDNPELFQDYEELEDRVPQNFYSQRGCRSYLTYCYGKVDTTLEGEDTAILFGDCGFPYRRLTRIELHIYNIRHIQHHAAQLGLRNQLNGGAPLRWVGKG